MLVSLPSPKHVERYVSSCGSSLVAGRILGQDADPVNYDMYHYHHQNIQSNMLVPCGISLVTVHILGQDVDPVNKQVQCVVYTKFGPKAQGRANHNIGLALIVLDSYLNRNS